MNWMKYNGYDWKIPTARLSLRILNVIDDYIVILGLKLFISFEKTNVKAFVNIKLSVVFYIAI